MDPVTADGNTGSNFNRYWYANNNPYRFTDPDGREACGTDTTCRISSGMSPGTINGSIASARGSTFNQDGSVRTDRSTSRSNAAPTSSPSADSVAGGNDSDITDLGTVVAVAYRGEYHDELVQKLAGGMRSQGANVLTEVKMCLQAICARIDILGRSPVGDLFALEVKTGLRPDFTPQQMAVYPHLRGGHVLIAPDQKVRQLGLVPGLTLPPIEGALLYQRDAASPPFVVPFP